MKEMPTLLRVNDVDQSIKFYTEVFGLQLLRKQDYPAGRFTVASLGYNEEQPSAIELSHRWGGNMSNPWCIRQLKLEVEDTSEACSNTKYVRGEVVRRTGVGLSKTALVKDPDGHLIKMVKRVH